MFSSLGCDITNHELSLRTKRLQHQIFSFEVFKVKILKISAHPVQVFETHGFHFEDN